MVDEKGEVQTGVITASAEGAADGEVKPLNAPVHIFFQSNTSKPFPDGFSSSAHYTWTITNTKTPAATPIVRSGYDLETFELDFNESGVFVVQLNVKFYDEDGRTILYEFPEEGEDKKTLNFTVSESKLEFPNGISPNGDDKNDELKPKEGSKGIVAFHAAIFNRWGQKLYSWDDVHGSWDGKVHGKVVKDGVYFLRVSARGSDGIEYNIKKAINVISGYSNSENGSTNGGTE